MNPNKQFKKALANESPHCPSILLTVAFSSKLAKAVPDGTGG